MEADAQIATLASRQLGVFSRAQARRCGLSTDAIDRRLRRLIWVRVHASVYRIAGCPPSSDQTALAAVLACGEGSCVSHSTAALLWRLDGVSDGPPHVTVPDRARTRIPGVVVHRPVHYSLRDVTRLGVIPLTTPVRTIIDLASQLVPDRLEDALDDALRKELVDLQALARRVSVLTRNGRRGSSSLDALLAVRTGRRVTGSSLENRFLRLVRRAGLPSPIAQHVIRAPVGTFVARVDFAYPDIRVAIEIDGYAYHSGRVRWEQDRERQNRLVELGWVPLRITKQQITRRPDEVVRLVRAASRVDMPRM